MRKHHFALIPDRRWNGGSFECIDHWDLIPKIQGIKPKSRKQARDLRDRLDKVVTDWQHETIRETFHKGLHKAFLATYHRRSTNIRTYHG